MDVYVVSKIGITKLAKHELPTYHGVSAEWSELIEFSVKPVIQKMNSEILVEYINTFEWV